MEKSLTHFDGVSGDVSTKGSGTFFLLTPASKAWESVS